MVGLQEKASAAVEYGEVSRSACVRGNGDEEKGGMVDMERKGM